MKRVLAIIMAVTLLCCAGGCSATSLPEERPEDFAFSLVWRVHGISSYDSTTGRLVKSNMGTKLETHYEMSAEELDTVYAIIRKLDVESYPDEYDPHKGRMSAPTMTIILTVHAGDMDKTISAENIRLSYDARNIKGQGFLDAIKGISDILTGTEEWQALPEADKYLFE